MSDNRPHVEQCVNGHYYNIDKYESCPHCQKLGMAAEKKETDNKKNQKKTLEKKSIFPFIKNDDDKTMSLEADYTPIPKKQTKIENIAKDDGKELTTLERRVQEVSNNTSVLEDDIKTVAYYNTGKAEPVVGWLVCINGEYFGESFNLNAGRNEIGRASNMDIALVSEPTVSRNKHTIVTFEPKHKKFYVQPGESSGLTYLNGDLVLTPIELKANDIITLGKAIFIFVPFCGEYFSWDDVDKYLP